MPMDLGAIDLPNEIPGFISHFELIYLSHIAKLIPKNKKILEIGSLFGRSATSFLANSHESVTLTAIDPFLPFTAAEFIEQWKEEHYQHMYGDEDLKEYAVELMVDSLGFFAAFEYYMKDCKNTNRMKLIKEKSQDVDFNEQVEVLFIDGDHFIVKEDFIKFYDNVDGLILVHDFGPGVDYGNAVVESCFKCGQMFNDPMIIYPPTSIAMFCKSDYWKGKVFEIFDNSMKSFQKYWEVTDGAS